MSHSPILTGQGTLRSWWVSTFESSWESPASYLRVFRALGPALVIGWVRVDE